MAGSNQAPSSQIGTTFHAFALTATFHVLGVFTFVLAAPANVGLDIRAAWVDTLHE